MTLKKYQQEQIRAKLTGVNIRYEPPIQVRRGVMRMRKIYQYRRVLQLMILGEKYATITRITGVEEKKIAVVVQRYAPHLLRGRGKRPKALVSNEKVWNPKSCKYV